MMSSNKRARKEKDIGCEENPRKRVDGKNSDETSALDSDKSPSGERKPNVGAASKEPGPNPKYEIIDINDSEEEESLKTEEKKVGGILLFSGSTNWDLTGRKELPKHAAAPIGKKLWGPHKLASLKGVRVVFAASGCSSSHSVIITDGGKAMTWGRNDKGQLGHSDTVRRDSPLLVEALREHCIVSAACGRSHTLFLSDQGVAYSCGNNQRGQCGVGSESPIINVPTELEFKKGPINKVACGAEFGAILDSKGLLYTFGLPEYGQLGHNMDGAYVSSKRVSFSCELKPRRVIGYVEKTREGHVTIIKDVQIVDVACGVNHSVAVDAKNRCFSWGFGGYGRLGHAQTKDEFIPRLIKSFDGPNNGVKRVYAGATFSMAINVSDVLYFWGQTNKNGEATMYPKPVQDLLSWKVRDVACCNTSIVAIADESLVSWGPSVTYGELCYGETIIKSASRPQEVKPVRGIHIIQVAGGYGHTLIIARDEAKEEKAKLDSMPVYDPSEEQ